MSEGRIMDCGGRTGGVGGGDVPDDGRRNGGCFLRQGREEYSNIGESYLLTPEVPYPIKTICTLQVLRLKGSCLTDITFAFA